uniref:Actin-fragmin kinase catalytic domain-containing protein n=2 Tax=Amorphochlora amoebiformis TaxID=1561963 RepID=A0A7S0DI85_9EUKA
MYGSWLAREIGIHVPELRLASYNDGEYYEIQAALKRTASLSTKIGISRILQRKQIAVMEYVNGKPLVEVSGIPEKSALRQVGGIIALDVVLNNFDRLPLVWNNQGNADNIFLVPEENNMYALDNRIVCPTSIQVQHVHLSKVNMLCDNMKKSGHESKEWIKLQRFWVTRTPMAMLSKEDLKEIAKGFRDTAKMCVEKLTKKRLVSMFKDLGALDKGDNFWMSQVCGINVEFILAVINVFAKHFC